MNMNIAKYGIARVFFETERDRERQRDRKRDRESFG